MRSLLRRARTLLYRGLSDETIVRRQYQKFLGRSLDLDEPKGFHEKICWVRLKRFTPLETYCADKATAPAYIHSRVGPGYTVPRLLVTSDASKLSAASIASAACVIKPSHSAEKVVLVEDTATADWAAIQLRMAATLKQNYYWWAREKQYRDIRPALVVEERIDMTGVDPGEVNIYCLDGRATFCLVFAPGAVLAGNRGVLVDRDFGPLDVTRQRRPTARGAPQRPPELQQMIEVAEALASPFPIVRVDFLRSQTAFYVNELTFSPVAGYERFIPEAFELEMGARITHNAPLPDWQSLLAAARACEPHVLPSRR